MKGAAREIRLKYGVIDELTGKSVGTVSSERVPRRTRLYPTRTRGSTPPGPFNCSNCKYMGSFSTHAECVAFVKGVEVVLNYMPKATDVKCAEAVAERHAGGEGVRSRQSDRLINGQIAWIRKGAPSPRVRTASPVDV